MQYVIAWIGIAAGILAAVFWLLAALVKVPDNIDTFIAALQRAARLNAYGATAACIAAICAVSQQILN